MDGPPGHGNALTPKHSNAHAALGIPLTSHGKTCSMHALFPLLAAAAQRVSGCLDHRLAEAGLRRVTLVERRVHDDLVEFALAGPGEVEEVGADHVAKGLEGASKRVVHLDHGDVAWSVSGLQKGSEQAPRAGAGLQDLAPRPSEVVRHAPGDLRRGDVALRASPDLDRLRCRSVQRGGAGRR